MKKTRAKKFLCKNVLSFTKFVLGGFWLGVFCPGVYVQGIFVRGGFVLSPLNKYRKNYQRIKRLYMLGYEIFRRFWMGSENLKGNLDGL